MGRALGGSGDRPVWSGPATFAAEAAAVGLLAFLLARLVVSFYPPLVDAPLGLGAAASRTSPAQSWALLDPFRRSAAIGDAGPVEAVDAPATTLNLLLVGVRSEGDGVGVAIIQTPDNQQRRYVVGDAVLDGATLAAIEPGVVSIRRADGAMESLRFAERASLIGSSNEPAAEAPPSAPYAASGAASAPVNLELLIVDIVPYDRTADGIIVTPGANGAAFAAAGLEAMDLVRSVNGVGLSRPEDWQGILDTADAGSTVTVDVLRSGAPVTLSFVVE
jgi:general secretion pathway protein C